MAERSRRRSTGRGIPFIEVCRRIAVLHVEEGGCTVCPFTGQSLAGEKAYAISPWKGFERVLDHPPTPYDVGSYLLEHGDHFLRHRCFFGSWPHGGRHFMDPSVVERSLELAVGIAVFAGQICTWDLYNDGPVWVRSKDGQVLPEPVDGGEQPEGAAVQQLTETVE